MLKTEWKEDFVYKLKELLQLFQSLPSAKMRMRTKIIVQVRFQIISNFLLRVLIWNIFWGSKNPPVSSDLKPPLVLAVFFFL